MPNETEPTQMSPEQVALHAECKVGATQQREQAEQQAAIDPKFKTVLDELDAKAKEMVEGKDVSTECEVLLKSNIALGRLITDNMVLLHTHMGQILDAVRNLTELNIIRTEMMKNERQLNEGRMSVLVGRLDVLEHTLQGKLDLIRKDVTASGCRAWDRRPPEPDYHDVPPGV